MKTITLILSLLVLQCGLHADHHKGGEFKPLHASDNLDDFESLGGTARYSINKKGVITGKTAEDQTSPNTFLATKKEYGNFELTFEVMIHDDLNTGVQLRSHVNAEGEGDSRKVGHFAGPQVEIEASPGQSGYVYGEGMGTKWLSQNPNSDDPEVNQHSHFKNGEWNKYRIVAKGPRIQTWINGEKIEDITSDLAYETHKKGKIGLQVHGIKKHVFAEGETFLFVKWRKLMIKEL